MKLKLSLALVAASLCLYMGIVAPATVKADIDDVAAAPSCGEEALPSYTGTLRLSSGSYDAYARLAKRGEQAAVHGYGLPTDQPNGCQKLGTITASGDKWTKLGQLDVTAEQNYTLELASPALDALPDANRPAIMLVPHNTPICIPNLECEVQVFGQTGFVRPTGTLLNENSLHVLQVTDPAQSTIARVNYYVDNKLMYKTTTLEAFDLRYVSYPKQKLARAIVYNSGQEIVIPGEAPTDYQDSFGNLLFRMRKQYPQLLTTLLILVVLVTIVTASLAVMHAVWHHRNWQYNHGIIKHKAEHELTEHERNLMVQRDAILRKSKLVLVGTGLSVGVVGMIIIANSYIGQIFNVDGRSMQNTYFTGDKVFINKISPTIASLNNREYIPSRGDVVVARAVFGAAAFGTESNADTYIIKRVIGLPGERVVVKDGILTVYNKEHPDGFQPDKGSSWQNTFVANEKTEQLDVQLSESELFLSGDNRPESIDSRFNGPIDTREIVGKAYKVWPIIGHTKPPADE